MPNTTYRIISIGSAVGTGVTGSYWVYLPAVAKNNTVYQYCVANEIICARLGSFLGLPVPPMGVVSERRLGAEIWCASLDFNTTGAMPPPVVPTDCYRMFPDFSCGLLLFDVLVANSDRHASNFALDNGNLHIFDHSHALFGYAPGFGLDRLNDLRDRLGISGGSHTSGNRHSLLDIVDNESLFEKWELRIKQIPDFFIEETCESVVDIGCTAFEAGAAADFLKHRRDNLRQILKSNS